MPRTTATARLAVNALAIAAVVLTMTPASAEKTSKRQQAVVKHIKAEC